MTTYYLAGLWVVNRTIGWGTLSCFYVPVYIYTYIYIEQILLSYIHDEEYGLNIEKDEDRKRV